MDIDDECIADLNGVRLRILGGFIQLTLKVAVTVRPHKNCRISGAAKCCSPDQPYISQSTVLHLRSVYGVSNRSRWYKLLKLL